MGFQLWAPSTMILMRHGASGESQGCLSHVHRPGADGGGVPEAMAAMESSLTSRLVPLFSLFLLEKFFLFKPPWSKQALAAHTAQPCCLPRILQQTLRLGQGFSHPGPRTGPRDLIVLNHSSYHQIFQCPLSLVSDLHICWNTVGCSLCSSDELGISLVLRGSGLRSHLSRHRLSQIQGVFFILTKDDVDDFLCCTKTF